VNIFSSARRASSRRLVRVSASTYQNEHIEKVPSAPSRPSGLERGSQRKTRESVTSSFSTASSVAVNRGSVGARNFTMGMRSSDASKTPSRGDCT